MSDDPESIPLSDAAALAYHQVFSTRRDRDAAPSLEELDLVALALSVHLPIYGMRSSRQQPSRISDEELLQGMFWGGAARFELWQDVPPVTRLRVREADLKRMLHRLKQHPGRL